jgi:hypothetical protein
MKNSVRAVTYGAAAVAGLVLGTGIGAGTSGQSVKNVAVDVPGPTVTVTKSAAPAATVTVTATATAAAPKPVSGEAPASLVLYSQSGQGIYTGRGFTLSGPVNVAYTYDCSRFGTSGNFIGDLQTADWGTGSGDYQIFANELGTGGSKETTVYPADSGASYHLAVNSECDWTVKVSVAN